VYPKQQLRLQSKFHLINKIKQLRMQLYQYRDFGDQILKVYSFLSLLYIHFLLYRLKQNIFFGNQSIKKYKYLCSKSLKSSNKDIKKICYKTLFKNACVLISFGSSNSISGVFSSTIFPSSIKTTQSATCLENPIS